MSGKCRMPRSPVDLRICFLCGGVVEPGELESAYIRVRDDCGPACEEIAHEECAEQAGLYEDEEEEAEGLRELVLPG
jgi:hypothetical protein